MWKDPFVEEVRKYRLEIENESNGDLSLMFAKAKEIEKKLKKRSTPIFTGKRIKNKTRFST